MSGRIDATNDPALRSWVPVSDASDFPIQNLPLGVISRGAESPRVAAAIGEHALDLALVAEAGLFDGVVPGARALFAARSLNALLARGRGTWTAVRRRISALLADADSELRAVEGLAEHALAPRSEVRVHLPCEIGDYVDFYASLEHATNLGRLFRPGGEPLFPNYRYVPVAYHGRAGTIVVSGTPVLRPHGQRRLKPGSPPDFGPTTELDVELEIGFVTGPANARGAPISPSAAREHIYGFVLLNDWSARDVQAWEYQPLGPFLGKSFATSISPWVVSLEALEPYRVEGPRQEPPVLEYLRVDEPWNFDVQLRIELQSAQMTRRGMPPAAISAPNFRRMYWNAAQQLAHATANGATVRPGDLFASGTISDRAPNFGSLIELTWKGAARLTLPDGTKRAFLEDGDLVRISGFAGGRDGRPRIGFGELCGRVIA